MLLKDFPLLQQERFRWNVSDGKAHIEIRASFGPERIKAFMDMVELSRLTLEDGDMPPTEQDGEEVPGEGEGVQSLNDSDFSISTVDLSVPSLAQGEANNTLRRPKCGRPVDSLCCGHCGSQLPAEQADLYGAIVKKIAKLGGNRADATKKGASWAKRCSANRSASKTRGQQHQKRGLAATRIPTVGNSTRRRRTTSNKWSAHTVEKISRFRVISAFAGCGGSSLGYRMAGGKVLLAIDSGADAVATYRANFPDTPVYHGDIADLSVEECCRLAQVQPGELDVLDGSPPCLGFSMLGSRRFGDPRNRLYTEFVRMVRGLRPKAFVMENVSGLVKGAMRVIFVECLKELKASGYRVRARLLNVAYFGVPQARKRVIFVGVREDLGIEPSHPRAQAHRKRSVSRSDWSAKARSSRTTSSATATRGEASTSRARRLRTRAAAVP